MNPTTFEDAVQVAIGPFRHHHVRADGDEVALMSKVMENAVDDDLDTVGGDEFASYAETIGLAALAMLARRRDGRVGAYYDSTSRRTVIDLVAATLVAKQRGYGHANISRFGQRGLVVRMHDKIARVVNLLDKGSDAVGESIDDTLLDIVGYAVISQMLRDNIFMLPLAEDLAVDVPEPPIDWLPDGVQAIFIVHPKALPEGEVRGPFVVVPDYASLAEHAWRRVSATVA